MGKASVSYANIGEDKEYPLCDLSDLTVSSKGNSFYISGDISNASDDIKFFAELRRTNENDNHLSIRRRGLFPEGEASDCHAIRLIVRCDVNGFLFEITMDKPYVYRHDNNLAEPSERLKNSRLRIQGEQYTKIG